MSKSASCPAVPQPAFCQWWGLAGLAPSFSAESARNWERLEMYQAVKCLYSASASSSWNDFPRGSSSLSVTALWYLGGPLRKVISPRHCLQKWHQTTNVENVLIFPGLLCLCVIVYLLQKAVVLKMEMLFGQKKRKKMLMFCSLALLVKIKLCGGNLCESVFSSLWFSFLPSNTVVIAVPLIWLLSCFPLS